MHLPFKGQIVAPMVVPDTPEYTSPIDGRLISGRVQRREDLKRNDCVEYEPTKNKPNMEVAIHNSAMRQVERRLKRQPQE
jgi:hypothetical protein